MSRDDPCILEGNDHPRECRETREIKGAMPSTCHSALFNDPNRKTLGLAQQLVGYAAAEHPFDA